MGTAREGVKWAGTNNCSRGCGRWRLTMLDAVCAKEAAAQDIPWDL